MLYILNMLYSLNKFKNAKSKIAHIYQILLNYVRRFFEHVRYLLQIL